MSAAFDPRVLLTILAGGGLGSVARYMVAVLMTARFGPGFPYGTLLINVTGSLLIGVISELSQTREIAMPNLVRLFWMVGVLGGFTTFSTFSLDTTTLVGDRAPLLGLLYVLASVGLGVLAAYLGIAAVRAAQL